MGQAVQEAANKRLYADDIQEVLKKFLIERNWLVHKSIDNIYMPINRNALFHRLKAIGIEAHRMQRAIEEDLLSFSESMGLDMSHVRAAIKQWYHS